MRTGQVDLLDWVTTGELAELAQVHRTTASRWRNRQRPLPHAVLLLLEMHIGGHVGPLAGADWHGWYFDHQGRLCQPDAKRMAITAAELATYLWLRLNRVPAHEIGSFAWQEGGSRRSCACPCTLHQAPPAR